MASIANKLVKSSTVALNGLILFSRPKLQTTWRYVKVEFKPPTPSEIPEVSNGLAKLIESAKTGKWKQVTLKEAIVNTAVVAELLVLFFIGEIIGRGSLIGYDVSRVKPVFPLW